MTHFVDGNGPKLTEDGTFRKELYLKDGIHLNHEEELLREISIRKMPEEIGAPTT